MHGQSLSEKPLLRRFGCNIGLSVLGIVQLLLAQTNHSIKDIAQEKAYLMKLSCLKSGSQEISNRLFLVNSSVAEIEAPGQWISARQVFLAWLTSSQYSNMFC